MNIRRPFSRPFLRSIILLSSLVFLTSLFSHLIGFDPYLIMERVKGSFLLHALRALFRLFGLEMPICLLLSLVALVGGCSSLHMDDNSAGAAEQPANLPPSPGWPTILEDYFGGNSESSVNQDEANPPEPPLAPAAAAVDVGAEIYQPLLQDPLRWQELNQRLATHLIGENWTLYKINSIIEKQLLVEKKMEFALLSDGFSAEYLINNRNLIRGFVLYPHGKPLTEKTYAAYLHILETIGPQESPPYRRILAALRNCQLPQIMGD